jgi:signal transduction histidine kinase
VREGHVELEIADRGPGIDDADLERVFERFGRAGSRHADGVGLGLAVCRGIAQVHGGAITAHRRPGGGASFRVALPFDGVAPRTPPAEVG